MTELPSVCVIGAGSSGIAAAKALHERGIPFDCFEKSDRVGGNWVFGNKNGMSSAYRSLHINTSRERMEYSDFPMPKSYPDFPHHSQIAAYFDDYVDHFGLRDKITFETGVEHAERGADGVWAITLDTGETRRYDALLVANGHHWDPALARAGVPRQLRRRADARARLRRQRAVHGQARRRARDRQQRDGHRRRVELRRGAHVPRLAPRRAHPAEVPVRPPDRPDRRQPLHRRGAVGGPQGDARARSTGSASGASRTTACREPDHAIGDAHPTVSADFLNRVAHGEIVHKPNIAELLRRPRALRGRHASSRSTSIVYCTGYKVTFPFFDEGFISAPDNDLPLFRRVFHPQIDNVFFVGLLQPLGAIMPLAEAQGQWIAAYLRGEYALPAPGALRTDMERERRRMFKRYVASKRHTMQVDFDNYLYELRRERRAGARRMREAGFRLPVPARARAAAEAAA